MLKNYFMHLLLRGWTIAFHYQAILKAAKCKLNSANDSRPPFSLICQEMERNEAPRGNETLISQLFQLILSLEKMQGEVKNGLQ